MQRQKKRFQHESLQDRKTIRRLLQAITDGLEKGQLSFIDEDDAIEMIPKELMHLKVTAVKDGGNNRMTLRVSWHDASDKKMRKQKLTCTIHKSP